MFSDLSYELPGNRPVQGWPYKLCGESWCLAALIRITSKSTCSGLEQRVGPLNTNFLHPVCMDKPEQVDFPVIRMTVPKEEDFGVRVPGPDGLFSAWIQVYNPCFKIDVFHSFTC